MIKELRIQDLAVVTDANIHFEAGLTVVTGETGAGKSIIVKALRLVLGQRVRGDLLRDGVAQASVEARFDLRNRPDVQARLADADLDASDELIVRRIIRANGRSRVYVNGALVTLSQLSEIASDLMDVTGQHSHGALVESGAQTRCFDLIAQTTKQFTRFTDQYDELSAVHRALAELRASLRQRAAREDFLRFQLAELEDANISDSEEETTLRQTAQRLAHASRLKSETSEAAEQLQFGSASVADVMGDVCKKITRLAALDPSLNDVAGDLTEAAVLIEESARSLQSYSLDNEVQPGELEAVEERLALLGRLRRKHGADLAAVMAQRDELRRELDALECSDATVLDLERDQSEMAKRLELMAADLTSLRRSAAQPFITSVDRELRELGLPDARLELNFEPATSGIEVGDTLVGRQGAERILFLFTANAGQDPRPLHRVASGGELSRLMLAIKRVVGRKTPMMTHVFDEIDAGVGGPTAAAIGRKLREISEDYQTICITHLPQVAVQGHQHVKVTKETVEAQTMSHLQTLSRSARTAEIARMLGGLALTEKTRSHAAEMLALAAA